jgi:hypothetical protein
MTALLWGSSARSSKVSLRECSAAVHMFVQSTCNEKETVSARRNACVDF